MTEVLKGTVSTSDGLREALEIVNTLKQVNSGVLEVSSPELAGRIGIAWGRYITGAAVESGATGRRALRQLLMLKSGTFTFVDTGGEPVAELRQGLGIDLNGVFPYVPDNLAVAVTPWLFDADEQAAELYRPADKQPSQSNNAAIQQSKSSPPETLMAPDAAPATPKSPLSPVDADVVRQARAEASTFLSQESSAASHLKVEPAERQQNLQEDFAAVETFQAAPSIDLPEGFPEIAGQPVSTTPPAHEMIRQLFETPSAASAEASGSAPNTLPSAWPPPITPPVPPPLPAIVPATPDREASKTEAPSQSIPSNSLPKAGFVNELGVQPPVRPFDENPAQIDAASLATPGGAFEVFDPGTAPENVFVKQRASRHAQVEQHDDSTGRSSEQEQNPDVSRRSARSLFDQQMSHQVEAAELPPPGRGPMIPLDAYKDADDEGDKRSSHLARRFSRDGQGRHLDPRALCAIFFVVSFAGTIFVGPRVVDMINTVLHTRH